MDNWEIARTSGVCSVSGRPIEEGEEYYVVLRGRLDLELDGEVVSVLPGRLLGVGPGVVHGMVGGQEPLDTFFFRVPGGRGDKNLVGARRFLEG